MIDFRASTEIAQDQLAVTKLWHAVAGLYVWEFVTTLDYEWNIIRGHRPYCRTVWIHSLTRVAALMSVILGLIAIDVTTPYNCEIETIFQLLFGYLAIISASSLIVLRIIAIWKKKIVMVISTIIWVVNLSLLIHGIVRIRATWASSAATCVILNFQSTKLNVIVTLSSDIVLLVIMLIGLLRLRFHECGACALGRLLWRQGLIWLLIATLAKIPPTVFICMNLNDPYNYMFQITSMVAISIAATRIHRNLTNFASRSTDVDYLTSPCSHNDLSRCGSNKPDDFRIAGRMAPTTSSLIPQDRMGTAIHTTYKQCQTPPLIQNGSMSPEEDLRDKHARLGLVDDVEKCGSVGRELRRVEECN